VAGAGGTDKAAPLPLIVDKMLPTLLFFLTACGLAGIKIQRAKFNFQLFHCGVLCGLFTRGR